MGINEAVEGASDGRPGGASGLRSAGLPVLLFCLGATLVGIGVYVAITTPRLWEAASNVLLGSGLILMGLGTRRAAPGGSPGRVLRVTAAGLLLAAVAIHFFLA